MAGVCVPASPFLLPSFLPGYDKPILRACVRLSHGLRQSKGSPTSGDGGCGGGNSSYALIILLLLLLLLLLDYLRATGPCNKS
jgi:hypothetical protein